MRGLADVGDLLDDVEFAQAVGGRASVAQPRERVLVFLVHVLHVAQPVVGQADARAAHRRLHAAAAVVAARR